MENPLDFKISENKIIDAKTSMQILNDENQKEIISRIKLKALSSMLIFIEKKEKNSEDYLEIRQIVDIYNTTIDGQRNIVETADIKDSQ